MKEELIKSGFVNLEAVSKMEKHKLIYRNNSGYKYYINKKGDLVRKKLNPIFNIYSLITIVIILLGYMYWSETNACHTTLNHLDRTCELYSTEKLKNDSSCERDQSGLCKINWTQIILNVSQEDGK